MRGKKKSSHLRSLWISRIEESGLFSSVRHPFNGRQPIQKIGLDVNPVGSSSTIVIPCYMLATFPGEILFTKVSRVRNNRTDQTLPTTAVSANVQIRRESRMKFVFWENVTVEQKVKRPVCLGPV